MIAYLIESSLLLGLTLLTFNFVFGQLTFFKWNRAFLLSSLAASFLLPFLTVDLLVQFVSDRQLGSGIPGMVTQLEEVMLQPDVSGAPALNWLVLIWLTGSLIKGVILLKKWLELSRLYQQGERQKQNDATIIVLPDSAEAFSYFKWIFIGDALNHNDAITILAHERVHVRLNHSLDITLLEVLRVVLWFNPLLKWCQRLLSEVHEYQADMEVCKGNRAGYSQQLVSFGLGLADQSLINPFTNFSTLKKRLKMIQKEKSLGRAKLRYTVIAPLMAMLLFISSCQDQNGDGMNAINAETLEIAEVPFGELSKVPVFQGCEFAADTRACFMEKIQLHIRKHFKYPEEALSNGIEGQVAAIFVIGADGKVRDVRTRGPHPILESEVTRILELIPDMKPGQLDGDPVNVPFSIPVLFKIQ